MMDIFDSVPETEMQKMHRLESASHGCGIDASRPYQLNEHATQTIALESTVNIQRLLIFLIDY